ncbi:hypothetical protein CXB49_03955 [Chromobacterium sp. ATCC 53434]|uniref:hypothetical protein n=1 Tax=Chromobacterium sp. (strain ATCC 53434 / SC 14030) TaxID=2059672 RepID=UPI000C774A8F|nr:hypothetical protein [Chromobacterium sp. ATCC 53434]AUH50031.1 hypothetical protein CXB49_03955 [Chromobacterium sp. ATCC 53434]
MPDKQVSPLPLLDTVSFDAELPFLAQPLNGDYPPRLQRETRLAMRVLAAPGETPEDTNPALMRLEAKLDLALEVSLLARHPDRPACAPCRLGLHAAAWQDNQAWQPGQALLLSLYPNPDSALSLFLYGKVTLCQPMGQRFLAVADISASFDQDTLLMWEKWVFRRHRRAILER